MPAELHITIGVPGCGKTTFAEKMFRTDQVDVVLASDQFRLMLWGDQRDVSRDRVMWEVFYASLEALLDCGLRVLVDATNVKAEYRKQLVGVSYAADAKRYSYSFENVSFDECRRRNAARPDPVPLEVMHSMWDDFGQSGYQALLDEGWIPSMVL